jgi:hypothetical protein
MASHAPTSVQILFRFALEELLEPTLLDDLFDELLFAFDDEDFLREEELFPLALDSVLLLDSDNSSPCPATSSPQATRAMVRARIAMDPISRQRLLPG